MDREVAEWYQPSQRWLLLMMWHSGTLLANGVSYPFLPGAAFVVPPRTRCRIERTGSEDLTQFWAHFAPAETKVGEFAVPFQSTFADRLSAVKHDVLAAMDMYVYSSSYAKSIIWITLWNIAEEPGKVRTNIVVEKAEQLIESGLEGELRVAQIAKDLMISHNQLTRLFVKELGVTPQEYIRNLRLSIAVKLLTTTTVPIKRIAVRVGVPDLRQFNRLVNDRLGIPPRAVRADRHSQDLNRHELSRGSDEQG